MHTACWNAVSGRPGRRLCRVARIESDPGTLETKNSGNKQRGSIGHSVWEGLPMLNVTFTTMMLFAPQSHAARRAHCRVAGNPAKLAVAAEHVTPQWKVKREGLRRR
jgi:hypothetical protein